MGCGLQFILKVTPTHVAQLQCVDAGECQSMEEVSHLYNALPVSYRRLMSAEGSSIICCSAASDPSC